MLYLLIGQQISRNNINQQQYRVALAAIAQKQADVKKAELLLSYTNITYETPITGDVIGCLDGVELLITLEKIRE